jgi:hypothetical protein
LNGIHSVFPLVFLKKSESCILRRVGIGLAVSATLPIPSKRFLSCWKVRSQKNVAYLLVPRLFFSNTLFARRLNPFIFYSSTYGDLSTDLNSDRYGIVVLIAGGIGVTPMQSICRQLAYDNCTCKRELQNVHIAIMDNVPIGLDSSQHNLRHNLTWTFPI